MQEKEHVVQLLKDAKLAIEKDDSTLMRDLSNKTIHSASIDQDSDNIFVAVVMYALSKILERKDYREYKGWNSFVKSSEISLEKSAESLEKDNLFLFRKEMKKIRRDISKLSGNFKKNVQEVFKRAEISKASRIYEHGISMEKTAKLLGVSLWDLAEYAGKTGISDVNLNITMREKDRINIAINFFKK